MPTTYGQMGKLFTDADKRDALLDILVRAAELMRVRDDCHLYVVGKDADDETAVCVMELWESKEAHDDSLTEQEVRDLIGQAMPMLKGAPQGTTLIPVSGKGMR